MATTTPSAPKNDTTNVSHTKNNNNNNHEVSKQDIEVAIAKAVELRALHAALMQGNSPANLGLLSPSPVSLFSAQDYPVFTPSYEDEPFPSHHQIILKSRMLSESRDENGLEGGTFRETALLDFNKESTSSRRGIPPSMANFDSHICPANDQISVTDSCAHNNTILGTSPGSDLFKSSRRNSLTDFKSASSCNRCKPATITSELGGVARNGRYSNTIVPLTDSHSSAQLQPRNRWMMFWLFPKQKKKHKTEHSPKRAESEDASQVFKDMGIVSVEALKKQLIEANENRDAALKEVAEMKSSMGEIRQKLECLESYCEELKKALMLESQAKNTHIVESLGSFPLSGNSIDGKWDNSMTVSEEVMVEGFLQIVAEARLSVKHFCKTLVGQVDDKDVTLIENLNLLLQPYKLSLNSKYSRAVLYHLEAIINQSLYQDFENCVFQKNGSPKNLDPQQDRQAQFSSFVALRDLSWNEVLRKGTKYHSEEFSNFCDKKMSCIITTLSWTRPWPEQLLQAFFVAAKCIWLLHLLAFSFNPALAILRVEDNRSYDPHYMEDVFQDRQKSECPSRVKVMVMPGFYVQDRVLKCKVLCRYKSLV